MRRRRVTMRDERLLPLRITQVQHKQVVLTLTMDWFLRSGAIARLYAVRAQVAGRGLFGAPKTRRIMGGVDAVPGPLSRPRSFAVRSTGTSISGSAPVTI